MSRDELAVMNGLKKIRIAHATVKGQVDHSQDELLPEALELRKTYKGNGPLPEEVTRTYGFHAATELRKVIRNATEYKNVETLDIPLSVLTAGEAAFVFAGYEMFSQSGTFIKAASPFGMTFIIGNTNGSLGYMPASECFINHGFEVNSTVFVPGTAEILANKALELLYRLRREQ